MVVLSKCPTISTSCGDYFHPYDPSCSTTALYLTKDAVLECLRIYCSAYTIGLLMRRKVPSKKDLYKTFLGILQSSAFLTTNATAFSFFICFIRRFTSGFNPLTTAFIPSLFASYVAINVERPLRRGLLCLYVTNVATETLFNMAVSRKLVKPIKYFEVLIASLSIAQLLYYFKGEHISADPIYSLLRFLVGRCEEEGYEGPIVREVAKAKVYRGKSLVIKYYVDIYNRIQSYFSSLSSHATCPHPGPCLLYVLSDGGKLFLIGYTFQLCLKLFFERKKIMRNASTLNRVLLSFDTMRLGVLFSSFSIIFKSVMCTLRRELGRDDAKLAYPAGMLAGLSFLLFRDNTIALYIMWKMFNVMYNKAVAQGKMVEIPYGTEILYSISTSVLFHAGILEPATLRPSYWRFLKAISGNRLLKLDRSHLEVFGYSTLDQLRSVLIREKAIKK